MESALPDYVKKYSETPLFTETTVPEKLTSTHNTKAGVWGKLCVITGQLDYVIPGPPLQCTTIKMGDFGIIRPEELHHVKLTGQVSFKVEFYK